jgi:hypothetical protein
MGKAMQRIFTLLIVGMVFIPSSCKKEPGKVSYTWTGQKSEGDIAGFVPVCIIWYKYVQPPTDAWEPYKSFNQNNAFEMREIILQLLTPEEKEMNPNLRTNDKLSLIFYNGIPEKLTVREVYFKIDDKTFIGPRGKSSKIAKILSEQQEVRSLFYYPYSELDSVHYQDHFERILQSMESHQKRAEKLKAEKKAEAQKKIE